MNQIFSESFPLFWNSKSARPAPPIFALSGQLVMILLIQKVVRLDKQCLPPIVEHLL